MSTDGSGGESTPENFKERLISQLQSIIQAKEISEDTISEVCSTLNQLQQGESEDDVAPTENTPVSPNFSEDSPPGTVVELKKKLEGHLESIIAGGDASQEVYTLLWKLNAAYEKSEESPKPPSVERQGVIHYRKFFRQISLLGKGGYGSVVKCQHILDGILYAIKKVGYVEEDLKIILNEVKIHSMMEDAHVVRYHHSWTEEGFEDSERFDEDTFGGGKSKKKFNSSDDDTLGSEKSEKKFTHTLYILMELCDQSLADQKKRYKASLASREKLLKYMEQAFEGLDYIHSKGYIHLDISRKNIFLDFDDNIKIGDFGKAKKFEGKPISITGPNDLGTRIYEAPESSHVVVPGSDIYSAGLVFYELLLPFETEHEKRMIFRDIKEGKFVFDGEFEFFKWILASNSAERLTAKEVVNMLKVSAGIIEREKERENEGSGDEEEDDHNKRKKLKKEVDEDTD